METIITAATVLAMYFNVNTKNVDNKYYYNANVENNKVTSVIILKNDNNNLAQKVKYNFVYDNDNNLTTKEALKWNSEKQNWENYYVLNFNYFADGYTVSRRDWNKKTSNYDAITEVMDYKTVTGEVTAINSYKVNNAGEIKQTNKLLVMSPNDYNFLAEY